MTSRKKRRRELEASIEEIEELKEGAKLSPEERADLEEIEEELEDALEEEEDADGVVEVVELLIVTSEGTAAQAGSDTGPVAQYAQPYGVGLLASYAKPYGSGSSARPIRVGKRPGLGGMYPAPLSPKPPSPPPPK